MKKNINNTLCPNCIGTGKVFNGKYMKDCTLCENGVVSEEIEEAFIEEKLPYE